MITHSLQMIRVVHHAKWHYKRIVFPGQRLFFEAPSGVEVEVHTSGLGTGVLLKTIPGFRLEVALDSAN